MKVVLRPMLLNWQLWNGRFIAAQFGLEQDYKKTAVYFGGVVQFA